MNLRYWLPPIVAELMSGVGQVEEGMRRDGMERAVANHNTHSSLFSQVQILKELEDNIS